MVPLFSTKSLMILCVDLSQPALGPAPGPGGQRRRWRFCPQPGGRGRRLDISSLKVVFVLLIRFWVGEGLVSGWLPACETESKQYNS